MNNENEVFRPSTWKVELYWFAQEPAQRGQQDYSTLTAGGFKRPTYTVFKSNNGRAYTRKTVKAGWYLVEFGDPPKVNQRFGSSSSRSPNHRGRGRRRAQLGEALTLDLG